MLKDFDFSQTTSPFSQESTSSLGETLDKLQRDLQDQKIPALILIDGWESSGKGYVLNDLTREMDPRYVRVEAFGEENVEEHQYPSAWRYWNRIPGNQEVVFVDRSFYSQVMNYEEKSETKLKQKVSELIEFEKALLDDNMIIVKFFLNISEATQKDRIKELENSNFRQYLVSDLDKDQNNNYKKYRKWFEKVLSATDLEESPWHIINAEDKKEASKAVLGITIQAVREGIERVNNARKQTTASNRTYKPGKSILNQYDLQRSLPAEEYDRQREELQLRAADLVYECYTKQVPIVIAFEGVDAAGKGGAIQRLTRQIDPRSYKTYGIKAPSPEELAHHYLWRFKTKFPKDGMMSIFDRSWYGRVLVERIEGFATEKEWERAYDEINMMEKVLTDHGTIVLKFFLYIDKDEQAKRFKDREINEDKNYKITEEDWRNRDKWDDYLVAFEEMLDRTNTDYAPWVIVASNDKYLARIEVLQAFVNHLEASLKSMDEKKEPGPENKGKKKNKKNE